ncbi:MAG: shikimate dehydrogenase [Candidatus Binatia bacterium]
MTARQPRISGRTRVVGLIGDPVAHSRSPAMHNAAFAALGLDWVYVPLPVAAADVAAAVAAVRALGLAGANVTVPHKEAVLPHLDALTPLARRVGAVNTIVHRDGRLLGDNTDVHGFAATLRQHRARLRGRRALVIGAGGAARAVLAALVDAGIARVTIANRSADRARALARRFPGPRRDVVPLAALQDPLRLAEVALVVNTTSLGLYDAGFPPLAAAATPARCLFVDLLYGRDTAFLRLARQARRPTADGSAMLLHQGARAFTLWTRRRAPLAAMRAAQRRQNTD